MFVDLGGGKNLVALLAHVDDKSADLDAMNYVALRAYTAAGRKRVNSTTMSRMTGAVPVKGALIPVLVSFADPANPATARNGAAGEHRGGAGQGLSPALASPPRRCRTAYWPIDFGGALGEPVTRGDQAKLPWLIGADASAAAATALRAAGVPDVGMIDAREAFSRK